MYSLFRRHDTLLAAILIAAFVLVPAAAPAAAQTLDPLAQAKAELWRSGPPRDLPRLAPDGLVLPALPALASASPDAAPPMFDWSGIAFHSYRSGAGDIYTARIDATGARPVIADLAGSDVTPRVSPDLSRIAFVSDRSGNREIYAATLDGSNVRRLTNSPGWDAEPVWSPDGTRIAYSYDDMRGIGIFMMNADGSNPRQLTSGRDYYPTWSPDGAIAFLRYADGTASLWRVNADGTGLTRLIASLPYAAHSVWSPDGTRIAFEYDPDGDGWNELAFYHVSAGGPYTVYDVNVEGAEPWMGSWSPDSNTLMFTVVTYQVIDGELFLGGGLLATVPAGGGKASALPGATGVDFAPDWYKTDVIKPVTAVDTLPAYTPTLQFTVSWRGVDQGGSGFASFDVEYRRNSEDWQAWKTRVPAGSDIFYVPPDARVEFRSRGRDNAGNVEPWPATPDASTRVYSAAISGQVHDVRGRPIPQATRQVALQPLNPISTRVDGRFTDYFRYRTPTQITASAPGYTAANVQIDLGGYGDVLILHPTAGLALPDAANYVAGGAFDSATFDAAWEVTRAALTSAANRFHGGKGGAVLGQASELSAGEQVVTGYRGQIATGGGVTHVLASRSGGVSFEFVYNRKDASGAWLAEPVVFSADTFNLEGYRSAADGIGGLHVLYAAAVDSGYEGRYCYMSAGSNTCTPRALAQSMNAWADLAADEQGGLHALWVAENGGSFSYFYAHRPANGAWSAPQLVTVESGFLRYDMAVDGQGRPHFVWSRWASMEDTIAVTYYSTRTPAGVWTAPELAYQGEGHQNELYLAVGPDSAVHLLMQYQPSTPPPSLWYTSKAPGGSWHPLRQAPGTWANPVILNADGTAPQLAYVDGVARQLRRYALNGENWNLLDVYPQRGLPHALVLDRAGILHIIDHRDEAAAEVNYRHTSASSAAQTYALSQTIAIPADSHRPTLSFFFQRDAALPAGNFTVTLDAGAGPEPLALNVTGGDWQHAWADLTPWAGKSITLRFAVAQEAGRPLGQVRLDDLVVSPWLTPVIESVALEGATLIIRGDNFMGPRVLIDGQEVSAQGSGNNLIAIVPNPLRPGGHVVSVVNQGGQTGVSERRVGGIMWLPRVIVGF